MKLFLAALLICASSPLFADSLDVAFNRLYNHDFPGGQKVIQQYIAAHPQDSLGYAVRGAAFLYEDLDRLQVFSNQGLADNQKIADQRSLHADPQHRREFYEATAEAERLAKLALAANPNDRTALLSLCLANGAQRDYLALIEKKLRASLNYAKDSQAYAVRLLRVDPTAYDAYFTTGFSEYLVGSLPFFVKWFVKFDDVQGSKEVGLKNLERVAQSGRYLRPFAQMLLANFYLREHRPQESERLLAELVREFPENPVLRRELAKLTSQRPPRG